MTISRDMIHWRKTGGLERWGLKEFFEQYGIAKRKETNPLRLIDRIIQLLAKLTPQQEQEELAQQIIYAWDLNKYKDAEGKLNLEEYRKPKQP